MTGTVGEALRGFLRANAIGREAYESRWFPVRVGPFVLRFPNPGRLARHDLHHVVTGAPPTLWGEVEVSAYELRGGVPDALIALLCVGALALGLLMNPLRTRRIWRRYAGAKNLYRAPSYEALLARDLHALRVELGLAGADRAG